MVVSTNHGVGAQYKDDDGGYCWYGSGGYNQDLSSSFWVQGVLLVKKEAERAAVVFCLLVFASGMLLFLFFLFSILGTIMMFLFRIGNFYIYGPVIGILFAFFIFFSQRVYPKIYLARRQKNIEKNLIPALQDVLVQINSGVPLFSIMVNLSSANYEELSIEFKKIVKRIHAGEAEADVLDDIGKKNTSIFFRRTLWQISNGMRSGSDIAVIIEDSIKALSEEQLIQIQNYGNRLMIWSGSTA